MVKNSILLGSISAAIAIALGAFGAHGLLKHVESGLMDMKMVQSFETAARYQMYHAIALVLLGIIMKSFGEHKQLNRAKWLFIAGTICFSGSLYLIATRNVIGWVNWQWIGPVTPIGGLLFMAGWVVIIVHFLRSK
jgi:hypothetical protein